MTPRLQTHSESQSGTELVFAIWRRRKWLAIVVFLTIAATAVSFARWLPDLYRATSSVLIERQQVSEAFVRQSVTAELETRIQMMRQEIMSRARLSDLITRFNLYQELRQREPLDVAVERMRRDIVLDLKGVNPLNGRTETIAFTLSYTGRDPDTVAQVANRARIPLRRGEHEDPRAPGDARRRSSSARSSRASRRSWTSRIGAPTISRCGTAASSPSRWKPTFRAWNG